MTPDAIMAAVRDEFAAIRHDLDVQMTRIAQLQQQVDDIVRRLK